MFHGLREHFSTGDISVQKLPTDQMISDILTKPLGHTAFLVLSRPVLSDGFSLNFLNYVHFTLFISYILDLFVGGMFD